MWQHIPGRNTSMHAHWSGRSHHGKHMKRDKIHDQDLFYSSSPGGQCTSHLQVSAPLCTQGGTSLSYAFVLFLFFFIDHIPLGKQGDNRFGRVCWSISLSVCALSSLNVNGQRDLSIYNQGAYADWEDLMNAVAVSRGYDTCFR